MTRVDARQTAMEHDGAGSEPSKDQVIEQLREQLQEQDRLIDSLHASLRHARDIGTAVGILMGTAKLPRADAFRLLSERSQQLNRKVRDIVPYVCEIGGLPDQPDFDR